MPECCFDSLGVICCKAPSNRGIIFVCMLAFHLLLFISLVYHKGCYFVDRVGIVSFLCDYLFFPGSTIVKFYFMSHHCLYS